MKTDFKQFVLSHVGVKNKTQFCENNKNNPLLKEIQKTDVNFIKKIYEAYSDPTKHKVSNYVFYKNTLNVYRIEPLGLVFLASNHSGILVCDYKVKSKFLNSLISKNSIVPIIEFNELFINFNEHIKDVEINFKEGYIELFSNSNRVIKRVDVFFSAIKEAVYVLKRYVSFFTKPQSDYSILSLKEASLDFCESKARNELLKIIKLINYLKLYETPYYMSKLVDYIVFQLKKINTFIFENSDYAKAIDNFILELFEAKKDILLNYKMLESHIGLNSDSIEESKQDVNIPNEFISKDGYRLFEFILKSLGLNDNPICKGSKSMFNAIWLCTGNNGKVFKYNVNKKLYVDLINKKYSLDLESRSLSGGGSHQIVIDDIIKKYKK